jgi:hypothetical protein
MARDFHSGPINFHLKDTNFCLRLRPIIGTEIFRIVQTCIYAAAFPIYPAIRVLGSNPAVITAIVRRIQTYHGTLNIRKGELVDHEDENKKEDGGDDEPGILTHLSHLPS